MDDVDRLASPSFNPIDALDAFYREFGGVGFYGLEYIIEDLIQGQKAARANSLPPSVDWFGLDG